MKNLHAAMDLCNTTDGNKKLKSKVRGSFKRVFDEKYKPDSKTLVDSMGLTVDEVNGDIKESLQNFQPDHIQNAALDMKMYNLTSLPGSKPEIEPRSISGATAEPNCPQTSAGDTGFESQPAFPKDYSSHSRIVMCKRAEKSLSSTSRGSFINNYLEPVDPQRKRPGEPSGVVTEIKAIQQTRRLLANARERTRVHTISAAFEALRKQVPCYSYGQKLSKLAILRIACNYILSLAQLADLDYTPDHSNMSFRECVEQCTRTLQAEGRSKKRKE
ncbi:transcription factor atoh8 isoform X2 [Hoplias malabaricus]|uniref:transcription factor atoh8 isoform X2 n=1 Tax=Hoplias malabaricus TaxID=27720 RepID=UPI00346258DB